MVGHYRAIAKLGYGGMAEVRLALAQRAGGFNKLLVLKLLREELAADPEFLEMFLAEARVAALLNHPNIVQTNEVGAENDRYFIAMEYLEGQPLSAVLTRISRKNFPIDLHVFVLAQILHGLHYAHELTNLDGTPLALIHRDVSPQNVFVTYAGQVKLLDFGIAKVAGAAGLTKAGILKGKIGYMAPEQARSETRLDRRADLFAVGVLLWEALAKQRFVATQEDEIAVLQRRLMNEDRKIEDVAPDADPTLIAICNKAVAFEPGDRWADAQGFAEALEAWLTKSKSVLEKELGGLLAESFREERSRIRRIVEAESSKPVTADGKASSPDLRELLSSLDLASESGMSDLPTATGASGAVQSLNRNDEKSGGRGWAVPLALLAALGLGFGAFVQLRRANDKAPTATAPPTTEAPGTSAPPSRIAVRVRTTPTNATLSIDNGPTHPTPYEGTTPKDDGPHTLRITADGYDREERVVPSSSDIDLDITLRKATELATAPSSKAPPSIVSNNRRVKAPATPATVTEPPPPKPAPPTRKAKHSIDETDPYAPQ